MFHKISDTFFRFPSLFIRTAFHNFYEKHPLFPYASYWMTGFIIRLYPSYGIGVALFLFAILKKTTINLLIFFILLIIPFYLIHRNIPDKNSILEGRGIFQIFYTKRCGEHYISKGKFLTFEETNKRKHYKNIQCMTLSTKKPFPKNYYILSGKLKHMTNKGSYLFEGSSDWEIPVHNKSSYRKIIQNKVFDYINKKYPRQSVASLLSGICLGKKPPFEIRENFKKLGLSHLLVISGFHFSLITNLLVLTTFSIGKRKQSIFLILTSTLFMLIQNPEPSVIRSWIGCLLLFLGVFFEGHCSGVNRLSFSLIVITAFSPSSFMSLSLQFSFLATAGIIFFFQFINFFLISTFRASFSTPLSRTKKILFKAIIFFSEALALNISAHLLLWPLLLKYFSIFPLGSLFYNLFFPPAIYLSVIGLLMGAITNLNIIHDLNSLWCAYLLNTASNPPLNFKEIHIQEQCSNPGIFLYLITLIILAILISHNNKGYGDDNPLYAG